MPGSPARCGFAAPVPSGSGISLPRSPASVPDGSSNGEALLGVLTLCQFVHAQVVGRPPFRVAVWGVEPEDADRSVAGQVQDGARGADGHFVKGPGTAISGGYLAVALQPGQPEPAIVADLLEVLQAGVPAVSHHQSETTKIQNPGSAPLKSNILGVRNNQRDRSTPVFQTNVVPRDEGIRG